MTEDHIHHHEIFSRFDRWNGELPEGCSVNFLGVKTKMEYFSMFKEVIAVRPDLRGDFPLYDEEYFEWIDLLLAVACAEKQFTMIELGAGYGRWICNAVAALKHLNNLPYTLVGVEAEPTHFQWMKEHLQFNGVDLTRCQLIQAAVAASDGEVGFDVGEHPLWGAPKDWYGQAIGGTTSVRAVSLNTLLQPLERVDLIDLDVQGAEYDVLKNAADALYPKVKRVHVETHNRDVELGLRELFARMSWVSVYDYPCSVAYPETWESQTDFGLIKFQGGVQTWLNPKFMNAMALSDILGRNIEFEERGYGYEYLHQCLKDSEQIQRKLHVSERSVRELEKKLGETLEVQRQILSSRGWRLLARWHKVRDRIAPDGTRRRYLYDSLRRFKPSRSPEPKS